LIKIIEKNTERDKLVNASLEQEGWTVIRFWEDEVEGDPDKCAEKVKNLIMEIK
jgi:very-short-patch-repair endonuclease